MRRELSKLVYEYIKKENIDFPFNGVEVLKTKNEKFGDFTTNISLKLIKALGKNPMEIAESIKSFLETNYKDVFKEVTVTNPGFVNMFMQESFVTEYAMKFVDQGYKPDFGIDSKKINYEFVSANPTGDLHIGHARNAIVGDITINIFEYVGHKVNREYYINDAGNQIEELAKSVYYYLADELKLESNIPVEEVGYKGVEIEELGRKLAKTNEYNNLSKEEAIDKLKVVSKEYFLERIWNLLEQMKLKPFDTKTSEQELFDSGKVKEELDKMKAKKDFIYEEEGAIWLKTEKHGDDKNRVLVKSDGTYTYMVADIANHVMKYDQGYDLVMDLWGADHHGYETRIKASLEILGHDSNKMLVDFISMVKLLQNGKELKMSKRQGTSLRIFDVLEKVDIDILRFYIISKSKEQSLIIDLDKANQESNDNPYFYMQYAHARMNQILLNSNLEHSKEYNLLGKEIQEFNLLKKLNEFEDYIFAAVNDREPYQLAIYIKELAQAFNSFYASCRVISENQELTKQRLALVSAVKNVYTTVLKLMGIEPKEKM